jgi:hypothetical protein
MRYWKGSIHLSPLQDHPLLRQILRSDHITHSQLFEFMRLGGYESSRQSFAWRVRRLVSHGLVKRQRTAWFGGEPVYSLSTEATQELQGLEEYFLVSAKPGRDQRTNDLLHAVELNNIHLSLLRAGIPARWIPTTEIRSLNQLTSFGYAKDYDAVIEIAVDGQQRKFALEYERSRKAKSDYDWIIEKVAREEHVSLILYLTANYDLLKFLADGFSGLSPRVAFGLVREWHNHLLEMPVETSNGLGSRPLLELLGAASQAGDLPLD